MNLFWSLLIVSFRISSSIYRNIHKRTSIDRMDINLVVWIRVNRLLWRGMNQNMIYIIFILISWVFKAINSMYHLFYLHRDIMFLVKWDHVARCLYRSGISYTFWLNYLLVVSIMESNHSISLINIIISIKTFVLNLYSIGPCLYPWIYTLLYGQI